MQRDRYRAVALLALEAPSESIPKTAIGFHFPLHCGSKGQVLLAYEEPGLHRGVPRPAARDADCLTRRRPRSAASDPRRDPRAGLRGHAPRRPAAHRLRRRAGSRRSDLVVASLSLIANFADLEEREAKLVDAVLEAAARVSVLMGWRPPLPAAAASDRPINGPGVLDGVALARGDPCRGALRREACQDALARAEADELGCLWAIAAERALADAALVDDRLRPREQSRAPGRRAPSLVKDCFDVDGLATTVGSGAIASAGVCHARDAEAVARLRHAGAVVAGKAAMHQLAWGMTGQAPGTRPAGIRSTRAASPADRRAARPSRSRAGIVPLALGTDSGGSVRQPAAWCGLVGFKPALGAVPLDGCAPMAPSLDTCGVLAAPCATAGRARAA